MIDASVIATEILEESQVRRVIDGEPHASPIVTEINRHKDGVFYMLNGSYKGDTNLHEVNKKNIRWTHNQKYQDRNSTNVNKEILKADLLKKIHSIVGCKYNN